MILQRILDGAAHQILGCSSGDRFDADTGVQPDLLAQLLLQKRNDLQRLRTARGPFDSSVNVFGVFAVHHNVQLLRVLYRAGNSAEVAYRADAGIQIQQLSQAHVQAADSAPNRRCERALDRNSKFLNRGECVVGQPASEFLKRFFPSENFEPDHFARSLRNFLDRGIEHQLRRFPNVRSGAVSFDKRNDGVVRNHQIPSAEGDFLSRCGDFYSIKLHAALLKILTKMKSEMLSL